MPENFKLTESKVISLAGIDPANLMIELTLLKTYLGKLTSLILKPIHDSDFRRGIHPSFIKYLATVNKQFDRVDDLITVRQIKFIPGTTELAPNPKIPLYINATPPDSICQPITNSYSSCLELLTYDRFPKMKGSVVGYQNTLDGFNSLKLPDVQKFAAEISSIKRNELLGASIDAAEKSLPKIISLVAEKCLAAGVGITEEQAVKLLDNAPVRVRHQVVKRIAPELLPGHAGATVQPIVPTEIKCFADLRALELAWYDHLVFHDKEHSLDNFRKWVTSLTELESQNHIEKDGYLKVIRHFCEKFKVDVYFKNQACYITSSATSVASGIFRLVAKDTKQQLYSAVNFPKIAIK